MATDANDLLGYLSSLKNDDIFLKETYKMVLGRFPDDSGNSHHRNILDPGTPKLLILYQKINYDEPRSKKIDIKILHSRFQIALLEDQQLINRGLITNIGLRDTFRGAIMHNFYIG